MLAEHLRQNDHEEEAVTISTQITHQFPLLPRVWMEHSLNLEATGHRSEAIQAAVKVRELNPCWSWGMRSLSEMMRKEGDYEGARSVLEELLRHEPHDGINHGWLAEVLWDLDEREAAITHLMRAVQLDPGYNWAWNSLEQWGPIADKPEAVHQAAQRVLDERPGETRTWMIAAERLYHPNDLTARLSALDKAISLTPDSWLPVDAKALLLGEAGRFDEALTLCRTHPSQNLTLRFREGWLLNEKGARKEAVKVLEEAVAEDPRYPWPWRMLINWYQQDEIYPDAERACRQLARLECDEPVPLGYLASVLASQKKLKEAREVFEEAVDRFPHYEFAFERLFWLHTEDSAWDAAFALLKQQADHYSNTQIESRRFILHCRRKHWNDAQKALKTILADPQGDEQAFDRVRFELENLSLLERRRQLKAFQAVTHEALKKSGGNPRTGKLHVEICRLMNKLPSYRLLADIPDKDEARSLAFIEMIQWIGERWKKSAESPLRWVQLNALGERRLLKRILTNHREWLRADLNLYGAVCYTLHACGKPKENIEWLSDWRDRGVHIKPYILNNLLLSLQETNQRQEVETVMRHGTTLASNNGIKMRFHIWCAMERLLVGDAVSADEFMDAVNPAQLDSYGSTLLDFQKLLREHQPDRTPSAASFGPTAARLEKFMNEHTGNPVMLDNARRACRLIGARLGSMRPRFWHATYRLRRFLKTRL
jgi:tetratricopeptide (TPR) repeat protein